MFSYFCISGLTFFCVDNSRDSESFTSIYVSMYILCMYVHLIMYLIYMHLTTYICIHSNFLNRCGRSIVSLSLKCGCFTVIQFHSWNILFYELSFFFSIYSSIGNVIDKYSLTCIHSILLFYRQIVSLLLYLFFISSNLCFFGFVFNLLVYSSVNQWRRERESGNDSHLCFCIIIINYYNQTTSTTIITKAIKIVRYT